MASVDERIVAMTFKGQSFLTGVGQTITALKNLKSGLSGLKGSTNDINKLDEAGKNFSLKGMATGIEGIAGKFKALSVVGITALATIANRAVDAGLRLVKALTISPIKAGLDVYETKINAIKTILANTQSEGTNLKQVTAALNQLNKYANLTVFNFGEMTRNIGTFTAAGVDLKTSVASIKGLSNLAALSGSTSQQASTAMFQLSQAIAAGTVKLQDWNSVVNAGIGGKVFQNALLQTARVNGVAVDAMIKKYGSFRNALQSGFITSKILTQTLSQFTGDLSNKQLRAMGFTAAETKAIQKQAAAALSSATQIRTVSQLHQALAEEIATAWSHVWEAVLGNVNQATKTLSKVHTVLENLFTTPVNNFAKFLENFNKLGGREAIIKSIANVFHFLGQVIAPIKDAFTTIFPPVAVQSVVGLAQAIERFTAGLKVSSSTAANIKSIFEGVFSVFKIAIDLISAVAHGIGEMFGSAGKAGGGLLSLVAGLGNFVTNVKNAIESGGALTNFFEGLGRILSIPVKAIAAIIEILSHLPEAIGSLTTFLQPVINRIKQMFSGFTDAIAQGISSGNFQKLATLVNTLLGGSILLAIKKFISNLTKTGGSGGLFSSIKESFEGLTKTLEVMQANLKSGILQRIAIAVGILAASLLVLSLINTADLAKALAALTGLFIELGVALKAVISVGEGAGIVKMAAIGVALNLLATAILILAGAVAILAQFSWSEIVRGLTAIGALLAELVATTALLSKDSAGLISTSVAMIAMAVAINLLAVAVSKLGQMNIDTLAKGVGSIAVLLAIMAGFNAISGAQLIGTATAMVILGAALVVISNAVASLGKLSMATLAKGIVSIALALGIIAVAMNTMPPDMLLTAASLYIVAQALVVLGNALTTMGGMSWSEIAKSLVELAASLAIIAAAMILMTEALPGAAALLVVSASLAILAPILVTLGSMSWGSIAKGLVALAGAFAIIGAAGLLLTPLVPTLLGLGLAITLLGVGILAAGAGVLLFATGLTALAVAVTASGAAILSFVGSILTLIPLALKEVGLGLVAFAGAIAKGGKAFTNAFATLLASLLKAVIRVTPLIGRAFGSILNTLLNLVNKYTPRIVSTVIHLLEALLNAMQNHMPQFINKGTSLIVGFLNGIARKIPAMAQAAGNLIIAFINAVSRQGVRIANAGEQAIIHFINGVANSIRSHQAQLNSAARNLGSAIISGLLSGIAAGAGSIFSSLEGIASGALNAAKHLLGINSPSKKFMEVGESIGEGMALGVANSHLDIVNATKRLGNTALDSMKSTLVDLGDAISGGVELNPRITPVLDLSEARQGFRELSSLSKSQLIEATASAIKATSISAANAASATSAGLLQSGGDVNLTFNQTNNSPEPLPAGTIYRQTKNQLSIMKGALAKNANVG